MFPDSLRGAQDADVTGSPPKTTKSRGQRSFVNPSHNFERSEVMFGFNRTIDKRVNGIGNTR